MAEQISATTEEQTAVASDVSMNTQRIRDVSEELATDAVDGGSQAELLSDLSRKLEKEIRMFKI
ncbi:hypothetical protein VCHA53O466_460002 [Vibrio chagasii]|nr:hypothetical protein VCHA53O466_460002 [Vibrio chagasii]